MGEPWFPRLLKSQKEGHRYDSCKASERSGVSFAEVFGISALGGEAAQLEAARASALGVRFFRLGGMAAAWAEELPF